MSLLQYAQRLYSLDTLDPRFTSSSKAPPKASSNSQLDPAKTSTKEAETDARLQSSGKSAALQDVASPPLWRTPEFYIYYVVFLICVPLMFKAVYDVSKRMSSVPRTLLWTTNSTDIISISPKLQELCRSPFPWMDPWPNGRQF